MSYGMSPYANGDVTRGFGENGYGPNPCGNGYPNSLGETNGAGAYPPGCGMGAYGVPGQSCAALPCDYGQKSKVGYGFPTAGSFIAEPYAPGAPNPQKDPYQGDMFGGACSPMHPHPYQGDMFGGASSPMQPPPYPGYGANGFASYANGGGARAYGENGYPQHGCGGNGYPNSLGGTTGVGAYPPGYGMGGYGMPGHSSAALACDYGPKANVEYGFPTAGSFIAEPFALGAPAPQTGACPCGDMYHGTSSPMHPSPYSGCGAGVGLGGPGLGQGALGTAGLGALGAGQGFPLAGPAQASLLPGLEGAAPPTFGAGALKASLAAGRMPDGMGTSAGHGLGAGTGVGATTPPKVAPPKDVASRTNAAGRPTTTKTSKADQPVRGKKKKDFVGCC